MFWKEVHDRRQYSVNGVSSHVKKFVKKALCTCQIHGSPVRIFESGAGCGRNIQFAQTIFENQAEYIATDISQSALDQITCIQIEKLIAE